MKNRGLILPVVLFCVAFVLYVITLAPDVTFTDAGELAGACASYGVAHPTGYPLFIMVGHLWSLLPLPFSVIYMMNLFAAFCTALSVSVVYLISSVVLQFYKTQKPQVKQQGKQKSVPQMPVLTTEAPSLDVSIISAISALTYMGARTVWAQATSIEVYSLHLLMITLVLYTFLRGILEKHNRWLLLSALMLGLSFGNHLTTILVLPAILLMFFWRTDETLTLSKPRLVEFSILFGVIVSCAAIYVAMLIRSSSEPLFNWGAVHRGWDEFTYHVLGKQYQVWMFVKGTRGKQFEKFLSLVPYQLGFIGLVFTVWGLVKLYARSMQLGVFFTLLVVFCVGYSINYNIHDIDSYFLLSFIAFIVMMSIGVYELTQLVPGTLYPAFLIPLVTIGINYKENNETDNVLVPEYTKLMTESLPKNSIVFSQQWDYYVSAFWYKQQIEGYRPDIVIIDKELLRRTWYLPQLERWYPEVIKPCKKEIDAYMEYLNQFERNELPQSEYPVIQQRFIAMLNSIVNNNIATHPIIASPEVFQGEDGFAATQTKTPFGLMLAISNDSTPTFSDVQKIQVDMFAATAKKYTDPHLEKTIAETCSGEITTLGMWFMSNNRKAEADTLFNRALRVDAKNTRAQEALNKLHN